MEGFIFQFKRKGGSRAVSSPRRGDQILSQRRLFHGERRGSVFPCTDSGNSQILALTVSLLLAGRSPGSGQAGAELRVCPTTGAAHQSWGTSAFWDVCQELFDRWPELRSTCTSLPDPTHCSRTSSEPGWSRAMGWRKGMGLGQPLASHGGLGLPCQAREQGIACLGMEAVSPGHCSPTPRCGAPGSGVSVAGAGAGAAEPACVPSLLCHHPAARAEL